MKQIISMTMPSKIEYLKLARNLTRDVANDLGFDEKKILHIMLSVDELCTNAVVHGNPCEEQNIKLEYFIGSYRDKPFLYIRIWDHGDGFEPSEIPAPKIGQGRGMGVYIARKTMDYVGAKRENGRFAVNIAKIKEENGNKGEEKDKEEFKKYLEEVVEYDR